MPCGAFVFALEQFHFEIAGWQQRCHPRSVWFYDITIHEYIEKTNALHGKPMYTFKDKCAGQAGKPG